MIPGFDIWKDIISWAIGLPFLIIAETFVVVFVEYRILKPRDNKTLAKQLHDHAKKLSRKQGYKRDAKKIQQIAKELEKEEDVTPSNS